MWSPQLCVASVAQPASNTTALVLHTADDNSPASQRLLPCLAPWHSLKHCTGRDHCHGQPPNSVQVLWSFAQMLRALPAVRAGSPFLRPIRSGMQTGGGQTTLHITLGICTSLQTGSERPMCLRASGNGMPPCMHPLGDALREDRPPPGLGICRAVAMRLMRSDVQEPEESSLGMPVSLLLPALTPV